MTMLYNVYENGKLLAGFMSFVAAITFIENWGENNNVYMDLVRGTTGEILNTFAYGIWKED